MVGIGKGVEKLLPGTSAKALPGLRRLGGCFGDLMDGNCLGAFALFVVIAVATGVGLLAFLTEFSSHLYALFLPQSDRSDVSSLSIPRIAPIKRACHTPSKMFSFGA